MTEDNKRVERATKKSFKVKYDESYCDKNTYDEVLKGVARNCKMGPFKATSGIMIPYYLNASTNFLDKTLADKIIKVIQGYIEKVVKPLAPKGYYENGGKLLNVGMEVAGGMMVSQLAATNTNEMDKFCNYVYMRKERKSSGTCQQLEGPQFLTNRTPDSEVMYGVWIDDALSTGSSMLEGINILKKDYNIEIIAALYLVDRAKDRPTLAKNRQHLADPVFDKIKIIGVYDLMEDVDPLVKTN
mmetsp:Transcript_9811/g.14470  ORF Transcript_9811/g.14470 Transcript_9811/m.14470 type:complete len:243 (+) Transcript_9811:42-770(+)